MGFSEAKARRIAKITAKFVLRRLTFILGGFILYNELVRPLLVRFPFLAQRQFFIGILMIGLSFFLATKEKTFFGVKLLINRFLIAVLVMTGGWAIFYWAFGKAESSSLYQAYAVPIAIVLILVYIWRTHDNGLQ